MPRTASNPNQYLKQLGRTWYVSVRVPRTLEKHVGNTHVRRSLKTRDLAEANRLKHAVVNEIKGTLDSLRTGHSGKDVSGFTFADAKAFRDEIRKLTEAGDLEGVVDVEDVAVEQAEKIEQLYGHGRALKWYRSATRPEADLAELHEVWLKASDYKESTNMGHRKALAEVLAFLKNPNAQPADVARADAVKFLDEDLTSRGLAYNTVRDRLASLSAFWGWLVSRGHAKENPWSGHKVSRKANPASTPPKRAYTEGELLALLKGTPETTQWPTYTYLPDLLLLGMFTACRAEELCSARRGQLVKDGDAYVLNVTDAKTQAGIRPVAVTHPAPIAVLKRRLTGTSKGAQVFPELSPGGPDKKFSFSAVKAFGRYRRACGVPDGTDLHSLRRSAITQLEHAEVSQVALARFVGHKVGTLAADTYSAGASRAQSIATSRKLRYGDEVETAADRLSERQR